MARLSGAAAADPTSGPAHLRRRCVGSDDQNGGRGFVSRCCCQRIARRVTATPAPRVSSPAAAYQTTVELAPVLGRVTAAGRFAAGLLGALIRATVPANLVALAEPADCGTTTTPALLSRVTDGTVGRPAVTPALFERLGGTTCLPDCG